MIRARAVGKVLLIVAAVTVVAVSAVAGFAWHTVKTGIDGSGARQRAQLAKYHQEFLEDQRFAATLPIFAHRPGHRDAGPVLGPRVSWVVADPSALERYRQSLPEDTRGLVLDPELSKKLEKDWLDADPALWAGLDFTWMSRLAEFDFWDLDANSPEPFPPGWLSGPTPGVSELFDWVKLRLAKGIHDGAPAPAIRDVEELARLCTTTEETTLINIGVALLRLVDKARERVRLSGGVARDAGSTLGCDASRRLHRAAWGALAHAEFRTPSTYDADWSQIVVGRCAALKHGLSLALTERPLLGASHTREYQHLDRLLAGSPECRLSRIRRLWSRPDPAEVIVSMDNDSWPLRILTRWVPGARRLAGEMLIAISEQNWFRQYEEPLATPCPDTPPLPRPVDAGPTGP